MALLGFGVVGQALARRLITRPDLCVVSITDRSGTLHAPSGVDLADALRRKTTAGTIGGQTKRDAQWVVETVEADVLVDILPSDLRTAEPSLSIQRDALGRGWHVVSASKGPLALHGANLREAARRARRELRASATVCGGTPALELLHGAFRGDRLLRFDAVLNGSANFVLSRLEQGAEWDEALREARKLGVLEEDPSLDLQGFDAAAKAVILANQAWGLDLALRDATVQGIMGISGREARDAARQGMAIRLVARAAPGDGVGVAPVMLPREHPLVVDGTENVVRFTLEDAGIIGLRGAGAGGRETASAVLGDLTALADSGRRRVVPLVQG